MVFAQGYDCDQSVWRHRAPVFQDTFRTVLFEQVGVGGSDLAAYNSDVRNCQGLWRIADRNFYQWRRPASHSHAVSGRIISLGNHSVDMAHQLL